MIIFKIPGEPVAKGRPRVTKNGTFTPDKTKNYEILVKEMFMITYGQIILENPIEIELKLYFKIPKATSKKKKKLMEKGEIRPIKRPDIDNCMKSITDALNGLAYVDDSQIVKATVEKFYSEVPRAEVVINEVKLNAD